MRAITAASIAIVIVAFNSGGIGGGPDNTITGERRDLVGRRRPLKRQVGYGCGEEVRRHRLPLFKLFIGMTVH